LTWVLLASGCRWAEPAADIAAQAASRAATVPASAAALRAADAVLRSAFPAFAAPGELPRGTGRRAGP
jgi:hypothetical protein